MKGWIKKRKRHADTDIQEDAIIRGSNCFKCCLDGIPMMNPELRLPQQGDTVPSRASTRSLLFPWDACVDASVSCLLRLPEREECASVHARLCARPSFTGRGGNYRCIDHEASSRQTSIALTRGGGTHTCLPVPLSLPHRYTQAQTHTHTNCLSAQPCVANPDVQDYSGKKYIDLSTHDLDTNLLFWYCGWNITRIHTAFTH